MLISLYYVTSYRAFRQIKIRHIFIMQFGGYFVKFSGHTVYDFSYCIQQLMY